MTARDKLFAIDLSKKSVTEVNMFGRYSVLEWRGPGSLGTYSTRTRDCTLDNSIAWRAAREEAERIVSKCTMKVLIEWLTAHGCTIPFIRTRDNKKRALANHVMFAINDRWFPTEIVNAAPNWYACSCGHTGPAKLDRFGIIRCGAECDKPRYALRLAELPDCDCGTAKVDPTCGVSMCRACFDSCEPIPYGENGWEIRFLP